MSAAGPDRRQVLRGAAIASAAAALPVPVARKGAAPEVVPVSLDYFPPEGRDARGYGCYVLRTRAHGRDRVAWRAWEHRAYEEDPEASNARAFRMMFLAAHARRTDEGPQ